MMRFVTASRGIDFAKSMTLRRIALFVLQDRKCACHPPLRERLKNRGYLRTGHSYRARSDLWVSSFLRPSSLVLRHSFHALKKKIPVSTAFITNIASSAWTTEVVVA